MTNNDLDRVIKIGLVAGLAGNAAHFLDEAQRRPTREGGYEGGLIPDPQHHNAAEQMQFIAAGLTLRFVLGCVIIIPFLVVWAALMGGVAAAMANHGGPLPAYGVGWLIVSGLVGLLILVRILRRIDGRPTKRDARPPRVEVLEPDDVLPPLRPSAASTHQTHRP